MLKHFPFRNLSASYGYPCLRNDHSRMLYAEKYGEEQMVKMPSTPDTTPIIMVP